MYVYLDQEYFDDEKPELDEYLEHYGVIGMKWGVRRAKKQTNRAYKVAAKARANRLKPDPSLDRETQKRLTYIDAANAANVYSAASKRLSEKYSEKAAKARSKGNTAKQKKYESKSRAQEMNAWAGSDASDYWANMANESIKKLQSATNAKGMKVALIGEKYARDVVVNGTFGKTKFKNLETERYYTYYYEKDKDIKNLQKSQSKALRKPVTITRYTK